MTTRGAENTWILRLTDGTCESDVPRNAIRLPRVLRAAHLLGDGDVGGTGGGGGGSNTKVVRWTGEPVRLSFEMDVPRGWAKETYKDSVMVVQQAVDPDEEPGSAPPRGCEPTYSEQPIYVPMDSFCSAGHISGIVTAEQARKEQRALAEKMAGSNDPNFLAKTLSIPTSQRPKADRGRIFVPPVARASAGDCSSLMLLHEAMASKNVVKGGHPQKATRSVFTVLDERLVATPKPAPKNTYCAVCNLRNAPCHHSLAVEMKEKRREAVYGRRGGEERDPIIHDSANESE